MMGQGDSVLGAMCVRIGSSSAIMALLTGGVWSCEIPENSSPTAYPACCVEYTKTGFIWTFENTYIEKPVLDVQVYSTGAQVSESICRQIMSYVTDQPLVLQSGGTMQIMPLDFFVRSMKPRGLDMQRYFEATARIELDLNR